MTATVAERIQHRHRTILSDPAFPRLKSSIITRTGLAFYRDRDDTLAGHIQSRLTATNCPNCTDYQHLIGQSPDEFNALVNRLTVGETYFFRYPQQFEALKSVVIPNCLAANARQKTLRIWSAGCSTGAEPYSVSIILKRYFSPQLADWHVSILATDINDEALARARLGEFSAWELRSLAPDDRQACFERSDKIWRLKPSYKQNVDFIRGNLLENLPVGADFDIILCRNVLIYFDNQTTRRVLTHLHERLSDGGWLFVGHAEPHFDIVNTYAPVNICGTTVYRRLPIEPGAPALPGQSSLPLWESMDVPNETSKSDIPTTSQNLNPVNLDWTPPELPPAPARDPIRNHTISSPSDPAAETIDEVVFAVRNAADRGNWEAAADRCETALNQFPLVPALHCYRALIYEHTGHLDAAIQALHAALYVEPNYIMARYHLGRCWIESGNIAAGTRSLERALGLLDELDDDHVIPGAEDLTARNLRDYAELQLALADRAHG